MGKSSSSTAPIGSVDSAWKVARLTGYHPRDVKNDAERKHEGPDHDQLSRPLHYFEDYEPSDPSSFIGLAADKRHFRYNDKIEIREYPGVRFVVRDNGGGFNGKTGDAAFDVPVSDRHKAVLITTDPENRPPKLKEIHWRRVQDQPQNPVAMLPNNRGGSDSTLLTVALLLAIAAAFGQRIGV